ncbi:MAG: Mov34/MPN/PAD-1 family protein [Candidatus Aenigmarchaeota archaeon]|nr:Mov34/MPN/PAD-1 family protein [Candidatus Aenigmarchaeota archaeon]
MRANVYIDPRCLLTALVPAALEEYHKEVSGYLIGANGHRASRLRILSAYPMQSDIKKPSSVVHGNLSAVGRVDGLLKPLNLVGGFHSHPDGPNRLSRSDLKFIREKLDDHALDAWLELVVSVKKRDQGARRPGIRVRPLARKIGLTVATSSVESFALTLSGYWVRKAGNAQEATLWTSWKPTVA